MSGISSSVGLISGIDTGTLINQLLAVEAQPKQIAQQRVIDFQTQQAAYLDLNTRLSALKTAAAAFNLNKIFRSTRATSSNPDVLTGEASPGSALGSYTFLVDRLVSTQQQMSRGFADRDSTAVGASSFTFEGIQGRLDRDTSLGSLNGGDGVTRGRMVITDSTGASATIDLSRAASVDDVLNAINSDTTIGVTASLDGDRFVLTDTAGGGAAPTVANAAGSADIVASLGLANAASGGVITGNSVYYLGDATSLSSFNDGNGIRRTNTVGSGAKDFTIHTRDGSDYNVLLGEILEGDQITGGRVGTISALRQRVESETDGKVTVAVSSDGSSLQLVDSSSGGDSTQVTDFSGAAVDLGFVATDGGTSSDASGTISGRRVLASMNSTLVSNMLGGQGLSDGSMTIQTADGSSYSFTVSTDGSVSDVIRDIENGTSGNVSVSLDDTGTGLVLSDQSGGAGSTVIGGAAATALGIDGSFTGGSIQSDRLQHAYVALSTTLASLRGGQGVGTGQFTITDSTGESATISVDASVTTVGDLIKKINNAGTDVTASINSGGDGILLSDTSGSGNLAITVTDTTGIVAKNLNLAGEASGTGADNTIDGSYEKTVTFDPSDTLNDVAQAILDANVGVRASVVNDGSGGASYRLVLTSQNTGSAGRFTVDTNGFDLGLSTLSQGQDSRVFFGSSDPANALLLTSSTNTVDGVIQGVRVDLNSASTDPVVLTTASDNDAIESAVGDFVDAFNNVISRIDVQTAYDSQTQRKAALFGDSTTQVLRQSLFNAVQAPAQGVSGRYQTLTEVGVRIGTSGQLEVDSDRLRAAIQEDPQAVADLFAAKVQNPAGPTRVFPDNPGITVNTQGQTTYSSLGVAEQLVRFVDRYVNSVDGILTRRNKSLDSQIQLQQDRISQIDDRLASRRTYLQNQFTAMEQSLAQLQSQQASLAGIGR